MNQINYIRPAGYPLFPAGSGSAYPFPVFWKKHLLKIALTFGILSITILCHAQSSFRVQSFKGLISGTSSLHEWESSITQIEGKGTFQSKGNTITSVSDVEVKILVEGIKSKEGNIMDNKTYEAFLWKKNPYIIYKFKNSRVVINADQTAEVAMTGNLTMAGTTHPLFVIARGKVLPNGDLELSVLQKLKMSSFGMIPPTAILGTIKVGNEVTVLINFILSPSK